MNINLRAQTVVVLAMLLAYNGAANSAQLRWEPITAQTPILAISQTPTVTTNFTCDSQSHACRCDGTADCFDLGNSQLCKAGTFKKDETYPNIYTCEFKF
jgi:hypothetical protein